MCGFYLIEINNRLNEYIESEETPHIGKKIKAKLHNEAYLLYVV